MTQMSQLESVVPSFSVRNLEIEIKSFRLMTVVQFCRMIVEMKRRTDEETAVIARR